MHATLPLIEISDFPAIRRNRVDTLQVNLGYKCNQSCLHCHVNAGPTRTEMMSRETLFEVIAYLKSAHITTLDLTGGAPELNSHFRLLVKAARDIGVRVMDRCNLTITRWRSSRRCRVISRKTSTSSAARACSTAASAR